MSLAKISTIAVDFIARTKKWSQGFGKAGKDVKTFETATKKAIPWVNKFSAALGALGVTVGGLAILRNLRMTANELERTANAAQKLGLTTEQMAGLEAAADRAQIPVSQMTQAVQRMIRRISDASMGMGELVKVFGELNVDARELVNLDPFSQLQSVLDLLSTVPQKHLIRTGFKFFDSEGVELTRLAGERMSDYVKQAERLGKAMTPQEAQRIIAMNKSLADVADKLQGVANQIVIKMAPGVQETLEGLLLMEEAAKARRKTRDPTRRRSLLDLFTTFPERGEAGDAFGLTRRMREGHLRNAAPIGMTPSGTSVFPGQESMLESQARAKRVAEDIRVVRNVLVLQSRGGVTPPSTSNIPQS